MLKSIAKLQAKLAVLEVFSRREHPTTALARKPLHHSGMLMFLSYCAVLAFAGMTPFAGLLLHLNQALPAIPLQVISQHHSTPSPAPASNDSSIVRPSG